MEGRGRGLNFPSQLGIHHKVIGGEPKGKLLTGQNSKSTLTLLVLSWQGATEQKVPAVAFGSTELILSSVILLWDTSNIYNIIS